MSFYQRARRRAGVSLLAMLSLIASMAIPAQADHVGGGFTAGGIQGQYFPNTTLTAPASFTRQDARINFNWGTTIAPGGSSAIGYNAIGTTNYSVQWTGAVIPRFSETYTFKTITAGGVKLFVRPTGNPTWTTVINDWTIHTVTTDSGTFAMTAGTSYDIQMQYVQTTGSAEAILHWLSPSTPEETIDPTGIQSINIDTYGAFVYADRMKSSRDEWRDMNFSALIPRDSNGWPTQDGSCMTWEGVAGNDGTYTIQFNGKAQVTCPFSGYGHFWVGATDYGNTLPSGAGYNSGTNTTTATMVVADTGWENMIMGFSSTQRTSGSGLNTGITNLKIMKPITEGSTTPYDTSVVFTSQIENDVSPFVGFRWLGANFGLETNWSDRCTPAYSTGHKDSMGTNGASDIPWEYLVRYANETGKDLWITIPEQATGALTTDTTSYVYQLAQLILSGDTINGVVYPGLNPNLRLYFEYSNEVWNFGFPAWSQNYNAALNDENTNDSNGLMLKFDGNTDSNIGWNRRQALRMQQSSNIFRAVWGDANMPGTSAEPRVRPCMETQYDNAGWPPVTETEVEFLNDYFNNADGVTHSSPAHPLSYYLWGEGGATYYNSANNLGTLTTIVPTNNSFESGTTGWTFTGNAGVVANGNALGNPNAPDGTNAAYIGDTGSVSQSVNFTATGTYAVNVQLAGPSSNTDPVDFYLDGTRITPDRGDSDYVAANPGTVTPPGGSYSQYSSFIFTLGATGTHTIKFVGTGAAGTHSFIDLVQIGSTSAIFAADFPADSTNSNQTVSQANYIIRTNIEANWAKRYGLHETSYEGGWALGGDAGGFPIQNYCKYVDSRAKNVQILDTNLLAQSGVDMQFFGTYATWLPTLVGVTNPANSPVYQGIQDRSNNLAAEPNNGVAVPATLIPTNSVLGENQTNGALTAASVGHGSWIDWNIIVPSTASYTITASCTASGTAILSVDDATILANGPSGGTLTGAATLTKGLHTVQVRSTGTIGFTVNNVVVSNGGPPPPPSAPTGLTATAGNTQILLTWNAASQATSYNVYRGTTAGGESGTAIATGIATTSYVNTGLTNGTHYYYTVKAVNSGGTSGASNEANATPAASGSAVIQINTGGPAASPYVADVDFTGGGAATNWTGAIDTSAVLSPAPQAVYQSERFGSPAMSYTIPGLTANAAYVVRLHFCENFFGSAGNRVFSVAINGTTVLTNFDIFAASGATHKAVVQQFNANANGSGQIVIAFTNVTNNALVNGIEILNASGGSAPPAPTGLTATAGNTQVALSWTASSGATSYNALRSTVSGSGYASVATGIGTTSYTNTGLTNGTTYFFVVTATNSFGTSGNSNQASATPQPSIPAAPTNLTATPGNAQVALSWTASSGATSYNALRSTVNGSGYVSVATGIATTNYTNTGLTNGTTYYFVVTATNSAGISGNSNQASATPSAGGGGTLLASEPFAEASGKLDAASGGTGWGAGWFTQNNDATIPGYNVVNTTPLTYSTLQTSGNYGIGGTAFLTTGRALDVTGTGPFSSYLTGGLIGLSGKTLWMSVLMRKDLNNDDEDSVKLHATVTAWNASPPLVSVGYFGAASGTGVNRKWSLQIGSTTYQSTVAVTTGATALLVLRIDFGATNTVALYVNPASLGGGAPAADITQTTASVLAFKNIAYYAGGGANYSSIDEVRFGDTYAVVTPSTVAPPAAPTGLTATPGNAQVALSWTASTGATSYNALRSTVSGSGYASVATGIATTSYTNTGLTNGTTYYFVVTATNSGGTSGNSNQASATPQPAIPPAPTGLTATPGNAQVALSWTASSGATAYDVKRSTVSGSGYVTVSSPTVTNYTNTGLTNGTTYYFVVDAKNGGGTSGNSAQVSATPSAGGGTGLKGEYYNSQDFSGPVALTRTDATVDFDWASGSPGTGVNATTFCVRWSGQVLAPATGNYTFTTSSDDGVRLWVNGVLVINDWTAHALTVDNSPLIALTAGTKYDIHMEYFQATGGDIAKLHWNYPGQADQAIPTSQLFTTEQIATVATATTAPVIDGTVDAAWVNAPTYSEPNLVGTLPGGATLATSWQAMWDSTNLYVLATVTDSTLVFNTDPGTGDSVEVYIDGGNNKTTTYDANDWQYIFPWNGTVVKEYSNGQVGTNTTGVTFGQVNITGGYRIEMKIPWTTIGVAAAANNLVGLDFAINDSNVVGTRACKIFWHATADNDWTNPSLFGTGKLK